MSRLSSVPENASMLCAGLLEYSAVKLQIMSSNGKRCELLNLNTLQWMTFVWTGKARTALNIRPGENRVSKSDVDIHSLTEKAHDQTVLRPSIQFIGDLVPGGDIWIAERRTQAE
jgi:hypothetical protein